MNVINLDPLSSEVSECVNLMCVTANKFKNEQIDLLKHIVNTQEKRLNDQELIINLLKEEKGTSKPTYKQNPYKAR